MCVCVCVRVLTQSCLTLCSPVDCSPPGPSVYGLFQARILEQVAIAYSRRSSQPRGWNHVSCVSCIGSQILDHCTTWLRWWYTKCSWECREGHLTSHKGLKEWWELMLWLSLKEWVGISWLGCGWRENFSNRSKKARIKAKSELEHYLYDEL